MTGTWLRLSHSNSTRPDGMSISRTTPDSTVPFFGPPSPDRLACTGRFAVTSAVSCGLITNSCRSAASPFPPPTVATVRYELLAMTALPIPVPLITCPSHQVSTGCRRYDWTLRSIRAMPLLAGKPVLGEYQTRLPFTPRIIRPGTPGPVLGKPAGAMMK